MSKRGAINGIQRPSPPGPARGKNLVVGLGIVAASLIPLKALAQSAPAPEQPPSPLPATSTETTTASEGSTESPPAQAVSEPIPSPSQVPSSAPPPPPYYIPPVQGMQPAGWNPPAKAPEDLTVYRHDGFFLRVSLGFGTGRSGINPDVDPDVVSPMSQLQQAGAGATWKGAGHLELLLGGTPTPGFVVGSGLMFWSVNRNASQRLQLTVVPLFVNYYLDPEGSWFLQGLVGLGSAVLVDGRGKDQSEDAGGLALGAGAGWEAWVGEQSSLGLSLRVVYAKLATRDIAAERYSVSFLVPTLSGNYTFH